MGISRFVRCGFAILALSTAPLATAAASPAPRVPVERADPAQPVRVSQRDVAASNEKVALAYNALVDMWTNDFRAIGARFVAPQIARYTGAVRTACGVLQSNNAQFCAATNTIYYDEVFVAGMAKLTGQSLGTDGDMTAVGIIAHEMGHAVAMELGHRYAQSYDNEATADCLAGAFAKQAQHDGSLEPGDVDEAMLGMAMAGDPTLVPTGNARYDRVMQARLARDSHGTRQERVNNFRAGFTDGAGACLDEFASSR